MRVRCTLPALLLALCTSSCGGGSDSACPPCPSGNVCASGTCLPPGTPRLKLSTDRLTFTARTGEVAPPQTLDAWSDGSAELDVSGQGAVFHYFTTPNINDWMSTEWALQEVPHHDTMTVKADASHFIPGTYATTIIVQAGAPDYTPAVVNSPQVVTVVFTVTP